MPIEQIIERVKKLLALSKSPNNQNEANAALNKANQLIDEYRLSEAEIEQTEQIEAVIEDATPVYESGRITQWKSQLITSLAKHYGCAIWNNTSYRHNSYKLVGRQSDITIVRYMFAWLSNEAQRLSYIEAGDTYRDKAAGKIFHNSYCLGFVSGVIEQLKNSRVEVNKSHSSQAIVKLDNRFTVADELMHANHKLIKTTYNSHARINNSAYYSGNVKGKNIHLGASVGSGSHTKLLK